MNYEEAKMHTRKEAEKQGCAIYLYRDWKGWLISGTLWTDWLYKASPDGTSEEVNVAVKESETWTTKCC